MTPQVEARMIINRVADRLKLNAQAIADKPRGQAAEATARQIAMWIFQVRLDQPNMNAVGRAFGRDRTTVRHALAKVDAMRKADPAIKVWMDKIVQSL